MSIILTSRTISKRLFCWFYGSHKSPSSLVDYRKKMAIMYLLIIPYWILTLPGCFLEGSFCNKRRKNKLGLTLIGYFLLFVAGCMLMYPLSFFIVLPKSTLITTVMYFSKAWLIIGAYGILMISREFVKNTINENKVRYETVNEQLETGLEVLSLG